jgi:DNA-directed RNA polymerase subunit RPC12/RpoP
MARRIAAGVARYAAMARAFFYAVVLSGYRCAQCGGELGMAGEGNCSCTACGWSLDPTATFQRCAGCGGELELRIRRYRCKTCGADVASRFLFDGLVFDAEYFRQKMAEHRVRKRDLRQRVAKTLAQSRSPCLELSAADFSTVPDLAGALDRLHMDLAEFAPWLARKGFDLERCEKHVEQHLKDFPMALDDIPAIGEDRRRSRIWLFIAAVFMAHASLIDLWQEGQAVMLVRHQARREEHGILGDAEGADEAERSQAWN